MYKKVKNRLYNVYYATFAVILLLHPSYILSQISEGGLPPSFNYQQLTRSAVVETNVPINFYIEDLRMTDNWQAREGVPMPVSKLVSVDYKMDNSGYRTILPGGENIWRLHLKAKDAVAVMLYYNDFYIPEGGKLFIYSADKSQVLGAYTHSTHSSGGLFASEFIGGDELILEYVESETNEEKPRICINEIGYGYNTAALREFCRITTRANAGSCMVDINCEEGDAWQNEKKSVCYTIQKVGRNNYICSASLMNNTAEDFKPIMLTARHCAYGAKTIASSSDMEQWLFYFHKEREGCGSEFLPVLSKTMTGCKLLVNTEMGGGSDGMLLLLNDLIPENYDVFYNGWDHRDIAAISGVNIHHPSGDYMKISTYSEAAKTYTFVSSEFNGDDNAHWNVTFGATVNGYGVTEDGSSGSPLYNENKLVVGTLTGGNSTCLYGRGLNIYGKLSYHWDKYKTDSSTRMDVWLDPLDLKVMTFPGRFRKVFKPSPVNLKAINIGQKVSLTWGLPGGNESPKRYNVYRNNSKIGETVSLSFLDNEPFDGSMIYSVSAVYTEGEESSFTTTTISYVKYKAPSDLTAERVSAVNNDVKLKWKAPVYEQAISWGTTDVGPFVGFRDKSPFYYGHKWSQEEISPLNEKTIKAVQFIPVVDNKYKIYISQGGRTYRQDINPSSLNYSDKNKIVIDTIILDKPFVIDGTKSLIVSIQITEAGGEVYPSVCDNGPAVNGKGNIYSFDGEEWYTLYNENKPDDFNYNFILSAIVSSESGSLTDDAITYASTRSSEIIAGNGNIRPHALDYNISVDDVSLRSSLPAAFPEVTKYKIYRCNTTCTSYREVSVSETTYMDNTSLDYLYMVTALYGDIESEGSNRAPISPLDIENIDVSVNIFPTRFSGYVSLKGYEYVVRMDVIAVSGKICLTVKNPGETINTSSLSPGMYFFRIYDNNGRQRVIKAIKTN